MKADDLDLQELIQLTEGNISLRGRRLVLHSIHAIAQFRKDLIETLGTDQARRLFTRFGFFWGQADAAALKRVFGWDNMLEWLRAGPRLHAIEGVARVEIRSIDVDERAGSYHAEVVWRGSSEAEEHLMEVGRSELPICWKLVGYASGFATFCLRKSVYFIERECRARGDGVCYAEGRDIDSWGDEIEPHLKYFEAEDIKGNVLRLTAELKRKSEEIERHRIEIEALQRKPVPFFDEGRSRALRRVLDIARRVSQFDSSVLITGETGVGKEVLATSIHKMSHRADGPFTAINCGALPETLLESELFGYKAGSFTGAVRDRVGLFEKSGGGTVFLDEIGDISPAMQVKILRVLQEREIVRIGENEPRQINIRIIAATHRDLDKMVAEGDFREDLLYRLRVVEIDIPPLRVRKDDILPLTRHLLERLSKKLSMEHLTLDISCVDYLQNYPWPGNVRELENALERAAIFSREGVIYPEHLPENVRNHTAAHISTADPMSRSLPEVEREHILAVLESTGNNKTRTAEILQISPATLWRKLKAIQESDPD